MPHYEIEEKLKKQGYFLICGVDEVGRGALFGPVVAGAVILKDKAKIEGINDSKKISPKKRLKIAEDIYEKAIAYSIGWIWSDEIDRINILNASKLAMKKAIFKLQKKPDFIIVDGLELELKGTRSMGIVKGDTKSNSIAAASIIAKVFRDKLIEKYDKYFNYFSLKKNKGYPTKFHINMLLYKSETIFHRKTFKVKKNG